MRSSCSAIVAACVLASVAAPAHAHDPPVCFDIRWRADARGPGVPATGGADDAVVGMSNRGFVFFDPATATWRVACSRALGISSTESPDFFYAPDGRLLVATSSGLRSNSDGGCTWTPVSPFAEDNTTTLAQDPTDPAHFLLTTGGRVDEPDGVYESTDGGHSWNELSTIARDEFYEDLAIAPSNPRRLYAAAVAFGMANTRLRRFVARSNDGGVSWTRIDLDLGPGEWTLRPLAIHPSDPDIVLFVFLASDRAQPDRLRLSTDAGATFSDVLSAPRITDASFGQDGTTAWATALSDFPKPGLWRSSDAARTFEPIAGPHYMGCAFERAGTLHACGRWNMDSPFGGIATSVDGGHTFEKWMLFQEICEPIACDPVSETTIACADLWLDWQYEIHGCTGVYGGPPASGATANPAASANACGCPDAGSATSSDAGGDASHREPPPPPDAGTHVGRRANADCGCRVPGGDRPCGPAALASLLVFLAGIRRAYLNVHRS